MCKALMTAFALTFLLNSNLATADSTSTAVSKSKRTALSSSLIWTLVPVAVGGALVLHGSYGNRNDKSEASVGFVIGSAGIVFGPGIGLAYAGRANRCWSGITIRGAAAALTAAISISASGDSYSVSEGVAQSSMVLAAGVGICLVSAICDISALGPSVNDYNKRHGFSTLALRPAYIALHKAPGLILTLTF